MFVGASANDVEDFLFLLPEPYNLARDNSFEWVVEYLDSMEDDVATFNFRVSIIIKTNKAAAELG